MQDTPSKAKAAKAGPESREARLKAALKANMARRKAQARSRAADAKDLADGIHWVLEEADRENLQKACLQKVMHNYSQHAVALKYVEVYNQAMAFKNYRI